MPRVCQILIPIILSLTLAGCALPRGFGPVSRSLAASRELCQKGVAAGERDQWQKAEGLLSAAVDACPDDHNARRHFAEVLWEKGNHKEAIEQLEEAGRLADQDATLLVRLGQMHLEMGQLEPARQRVEHALDLDPKLPEAWATRGRLLQVAGRTKEALADYHRALGLAPADPDIQLHIAELYTRLDQPQRALAALNSLADGYAPGEEPRQVLRMQGLAYAALGRHDDAAKSFTQASSRGDPDPKIFHLLACAEMAAGRPQQASAAAGQALAIDPNHQPSHEMLDRLRLAQYPTELSRR